MEPNLDERAIVVVFNEASKSLNDAVIAEISGWFEVQSAQYCDGGNFRTGDVVLNRRDDIRSVADRIKNLQGVRGVLPPLHYFDPFK